MYIPKRMLWWRIIKLGMLAITMIWITNLEIYIRDAPYLRGIKMIKHVFWVLLRFIKLFHSQLLNKDFLKSKYIVVDYQDALLVRR